MVHNQQRRHSRWYEKLLFNFWFQLIIGFVTVVLVPSIIMWPELLKMQQFVSAVQSHTTLANAFAFFLSFVLYKKIQKFPGARLIIYLLPSVTISWACIIGIILLLRLDYSRSALFMSFLIANCWMIFGYYIGRRYQYLKLALVPYGDLGGIGQFKHVDSRILSKPSLGNTRYDAVVADLRADMPDEWQTFLANCALANMPVYHCRLMVEQLSGRVKINHLSENIFGTLQPSPLYSVIKRLVDIIAIMMCTPFVLPVIILVAILIKIDSRGPAFYVQERMGYKNKVFRMYKLRSMRNDIQGKAFTENGIDPRITKIGHVIRKYRIDELPQFLNVLKGDMSLIGPRPESLELSQWYEKEIAFFNYRHIVRPGITGWAQVTQGYAAEVDGVTTKLQYDFYYIKHFSFWLDILIVLKTIRTMLTGFGAR